MVLCPYCKGEKKQFVHLNTINPKTHGFQWVPCMCCKEKGEITDEHYTQIKHGKLLRKSRIDRGLTLRQEAERLGISAIELSKRERGVI